MSKESIIGEPVKELMLTMSAWRRLKTKAIELQASNHILGPIMLYYMNEAWADAEKDMKDNEQKLKKKMKEARNESK